MEISLHEAAKHGCIEVVSSLLEHGVDIESKNEMGGTALFSAANHPEVISMLLAHNANLHAAIKSKNNKSVLHHYVSIGCIDGVYVLLNSGCNIEQVDTNGETALHYAAKEKYVDVAQLLLSRGIDPDIQTATQESALQIGTRTKNLELIRVMLRHGANLEVKDSQQKRRYS
jgi:ankyrin repeat protein